MDQGQVLSSLAQMIDGVLPGCRRYAPVVGHSGGIAIAVPGGGQVVVSGFQVGVLITAGLARDVPNMTGAISWVNSRNSDFAFGRFYASLPADGALRANVVWQDVIPWFLLEQFPALVDAYVPQMIKLGTDIAGNEAGGVLQEVGGLPFNDDDADRSLPVAAVMG